jgi:hypothetical protein
VEVDWESKWPKNRLSGQMDNFRVADQPERAKKGASNFKGVLPGAFFDQVTFLLSFEETQCTRKTMTVASSV